MSLTAKDIEEITRLLENSGFDELDLEIGGMKIHLRRGGSGARQEIPGFAQQSIAQTPAATAANPGISCLAPSVSAPLHLTPVRAPLLGTFYRAPKPGAPPFVEVGAAVEPDSIVGIIEVMKLMNTVRAGVRGVITEIRARDGALVEFGEVLLNVDARNSG